MPGEDLVREGMEVYGSDGQLIGKITNIRRPPTLKVARLELEGPARVPTSAIAKIEGDRIYLPNPAVQYRRWTGQQEFDYVPPGREEEAEIGLV